MLWASVLLQQAVPYVRCREEFHFMRSMFHEKSAKGKIIFRKNKILCTKFDEQIYGFKEAWNFHIVKLLLLRTFHFSSKTEIMMKMRSRNAAW